ncbi:hypothetical protein [Ralstonia pseudosolanacearum]|nr:hypothetical protein [Ralstonia pseudosolanacearum]
MEQAKAIVEYLLFKVAEEGERGYFTPHIRQALSNYWLARAESKVE